MGSKGKKLTGDISNVFRSKYMTQTHLINNAKEFQKQSSNVRNLLKQMNKRTCIINQGEIYIQKQTERQAAHLSNFDNKSRISTQLWYDQLRS